VVAEAARSFGGNGCPAASLMLSRSLQASAAVDRTGALVIQGCWDGAIYLLDVGTGEVIASFRTEGEVKCTALVDSRNRCPDYCEPVVLTSAGFGSAPTTDTSMCSLYRSCSWWPSFLLAARFTAGPWK
jgi:outer membrane protein assembly factor BamB